MKELHRLGISEIRARFEEGALTAGRLTDAMLERAHALDPRLNAFVSIGDEQARRRAGELDALGLERAPNEPPRGIIGHRAHKGCFGPEAARMHRYVEAVAARIHPPVREVAIRVIVPDGDDPNHCASF